MLNVMKPDSSAQKSDLPGMGAEMQFKSYMPRYCSPGDLNEDANGYSSWSVHCRDGPLQNGQLYNSSRPSAVADLCIGYDRDSVKKKMLEHEAVFKKQVYELHRLYRIQKDLMDAIKRKDVPSSCLASRSLVPEDAWKWQSPGTISSRGRQSISGSEASCSPIKSWTGHNSPQTFPLQQQKQDGFSSKVPEQFEFRPSKVRRRMFDLALPAEHYIDTEESKSFKGKTYHWENKSMVDLNQPGHIEDTNVPVQPQTQTLHGRKILSKEFSSKSECGSSDGMLSNQHADNNGSGRGWLYHSTNAGHENVDLKHALQSKIHDIPAHSPAHNLNQHKFSLVTDLTKSNLHSLSAREMPSGILTEKSLSFEGGACPDPSSIYNQNFQRPTLGHGSLGKRWQQNGGKHDSGLGNKSPHDQIGLFPVSSSSGPKGILNRLGDQDSVGVKPSAMMDLNEALSDGEEMQEDHLTILPWMKVKPYEREDGIPNTDSGLKEKIPSQLPTGLTGTGKSEDEIAESGRNIRMFDINLPSDQIPELNNVIREATPFLENEVLSTKSSGLEREIDLNSCADEGETFLSIDEGAVGRKISVTIDLETPACLEMEEISSEDEMHIQSHHGEIEHRSDETKIAADVILAISSAVLDLPEPSSAENLKWFASIVLKEIQIPDCRSPSLGLDYFECMTLKLTEMKDEEHLLQQPLALLETLKLREEEAAIAKLAANHRPQRRGRQKRDFQRDILPGLISLSRHEVMEDMQTFCGIMRATGHTWNCAPTRGKLARNRSARPKRNSTSCPSPPVPFPANTPALNLTSWGKTRRLRRQRCPAPLGMTPLIQLT
ncbi:hypothetical protein SAY87_001662 [Trapa incisa]|uniref:Uncharacterized protein n=1 Tax=Trapa incisa TaxID=236973 RepID=A0AAN7PTT5_9MYRT|nr:hypothetical protein SAY87_001662 [Trapa incisa]